MRLPFLLCLMLTTTPGLVAAASTTTTAGPTVSHIQVRIVTGGTELAAGSLVELRIYEAGKSVRRLTLTHGEAWPRDATRLIPLTLTEPLDPRGVRRFGVYYRAGSPLAGAWELVSAEVELASAHASPERLLNATVSGIVERQGELATDDHEIASMLCGADSDCDDHRRCNGPERCDPKSRDADARGCVKGLPVACPVNQVCTETRGCRGLDSDASPVATKAAVGH